MKEVRVGMVLLGLVGLLPARAQSPQSAALKQALARATSDTSRVLLLADLSASYRYSHLDSVRFYARRGLQLAKRINYTKGEGRCLSRLSILMGERGDLPQALRTNLAALRLNRQANDWEGTARTLNQTGLLYQALDDFKPALAYYFRSKNIYERHHVEDDSQLISVLTNIGATYVGKGQLDSAAYYLNRAYSLTRTSRSVHQSSWGNPAPYVLRELGLLKATEKYPEQALAYYRRSAQAAYPENDRRSVSRAYQYIAELYQARQQSDSSIHYARKALAVGQTLPFIVGIVRNSHLLTETFDARQQPDSTLKYMRVMAAAEDSLFNPQRIKQLDAIGFAEQQRLQELEDERDQQQGRLRLYALLAGLGGLAVLALLQWRHNRHQSLANKLLKQLNAQVTHQKEELQAQRDQLAQTLQELRTTQGKLVMREKMASLGQLMAGVAQEIQLPAQHISSAAEACLRLCQELRAEVAKGMFVTDDRLVVDELLLKLTRQQAKIVQHSQRANDIVGGMLDYSSGSPGTRQPTDINTLAHDYLRLTYHDLRARNHAFHAALFTRFDPTVELIHVVRHDLGRALISLFANAFYAVQERNQQDEDDYVPQVILATRATPGGVEIRVRDNGLGIPEEDLPNIFDRFFTTKPAGEGIGLGLSVCYDIITRGHHGTLNVESEVGQFTEFVVRLPAHMQVGVTAPAVVG